MRDGGPNNWRGIADGKCSSPTPNLKFADCYEQTTHFSFDNAPNWGYCQRPGYFWQGFKVDGEGEVHNLNTIRCCKPTYEWDETLKCSS